MPKRSLTQLAQAFSSDKFYRHSYLPTYERILANRKMYRLLEIGVGYKDLMQPFLPEGVEYCHGSSLRMWSEYWPDAEIYACDIREDALVNEGNIKSWIADQSREYDLLRLVQNCGGKLDVIIDDGSHQFAHQKGSAWVLLPWLNKGGVYVIEDTYPDTGTELCKLFGGRLVVGTKQPDDCLVIIER